jgi:hypothetical protein
MRTRGWRVVLESQNMFLILCKYRKTYIQDHRSQDFVSDCMLQEEVVPESHWDLQ